MPVAQNLIPLGNLSGKRLRRGTLNWLSLLILVLAVVAAATCLSSCKAWRTYTVTSTYSVAPDKSGNPVTTIQTKTCEEYTGVKK